MKNAPQPIYNNFPVKEYNNQQQNASKSSEGTNFCTKNHHKNINNKQ